jgi:ribonuclease P protein component
MKDVCSKKSGAEGDALKRHYLPKSSRLAGNKVFKAVLARKLRFSNELLTLYLAENKRSRPRVGISVGKSLGTSVQRNRVKRLLREVFRQSQDQVPAGFDYVLMLSKKQLDFEARMLNFEQLREAFMGLVADAKKKIGKH